MAPVGSDPLHRITRKQLAIFKVDVSHCRKYGWATTSGSSVPHSGMHEA